MDVSLQAGKASVTVTTMSPPRRGSAYVTRRAAAFFGLYAKPGTKDVNFDIRNGGPKGARIFPGNLVVEKAWDVYDDIGGFGLLQPIYCGDGIYVKAGGPGANEVIWQVQYVEE